MKVCNSIEMANQLSLSILFIYLYSYTYLLKHTENKIKFRLDSKLNVYFTWS